MSLLDAEVKKDGPIDCIMVGNSMVDDGFNDGSSEIAREFAYQNPQRIRYLEHSEHQNLGMSISRNLGIRNAKGDYITFLDSDDLWLPEK